MTSGRDLWRSVRTPLLVGAVRIIGALVARLSWSRAQRWGRRLGRLGWRLARHQRDQAIIHLSIAIPSYSRSERDEIVRACFEHLGAVLLECLHLAPRGCAGIEEHVTVEGLDILRKARESDRPLVVITGHCGNWELLAAAVSCSGIPLSVVARRLDEPSLDRMLVGIRDAFGTTSIGRGGRGAARELLRALRQGDALGMLIDQDTDVEGCWVPFFGRLAYTPLGAAELARSRGATVIPLFIHRREDGSHHVRVESPLELPDDPVAATELMTERIEEQIRAHPEQWVWMHRRWRRRPPE